MPLKNWCSIHARCFQKQYETFHTFLLHFFPSLKQNLIACRTSKVSSLPDCNFEIHQLWQSGFRRVYSYLSCSCLFEAEIMKIGQSSHKIYSNNIVNFQVSTTILNACTKKKSRNLLNSPRIYIYIYIYIVLRKSKARKFKILNYFAYYWNLTGCYLLYNSDFYCSHNSIYLSKYPRI